MEQGLSTFGDLAKDPKTGKFVSAQEQMARDVVIMRIVLGLKR